MLRLEPMIEWPLKYRRDRLDFCVNLMQASMEKFMVTALPVYYNKKQNVSDNKSYAPWDEKPRLVFEAARNLGLPIVWNNAGGYQDPVSKVMALHVASLEECLQAC